MKNKYIRHSHLSETKFREIVKCFDLDLTATQTAEITALHRITIDRLISEYNQETSAVSGEIEVDESYFGAKRVKGKRGREVGSKTIVFGLFKLNGKVYTKSVIHSDKWSGCDGLVDLGFEKHFRVYYSKDEFSKGSGNHINGIENF